MSRSSAARGPAGGPGRRKGYRYLGSFAVHGDLIVADRLYLRSPRLDLTHRFRAKSGVWHAWTRLSEEELPRVKLVVIVHERHVALSRTGWHRTDAVPRVGPDVPVDTGVVALVDARRCDSDTSFAKRLYDIATATPEALIDGSGCTVTAGYGDGTYPIGIETSRGAAVFAQVGFLFDDDDDKEHEANPAASVAKTATSNRRLAVGTKVKGRRGA